MYGGVALYISFCFAIVNWSNGRLLVHGAYTGTTGWTQVVWNDYSRDQTYLDQINSKTSLAPLAQP